MKRIIVTGLALYAIPAAAFSQAVTHADRSGTITIGGTAQTLAPAWKGRHGCAIQNQSTGDLWVNSTAAAVASQPSFLIAPGAMYLCLSPASDGAFSIIGATPGQAFAAREW